LATTPIQQHGQAETIEEAMEITEQELTRHLRTLLPLMLDLGVLEVNNTEPLSTQDQAAKAAQWLNSKGFELKKCRNGLWKCNLDGLYNIVNDYGVIQIAEGLGYTEHRLYKICSF